MKLKQSISRFQRCIYFVEINIEPADPTGIAATDSTSKNLHRFKSGCESGCRALLGQFHQGEQCAIDRHIHLKFRAATGNETV